MRRFLIISVLTVGALTVGWRYAPDGMREKLLGLAGLANFGSTVHTLRDAVRPEDPVARRASEINTLKQKIGAIRKGVQGVQNSESSGMNPAPLKDVEKAADEAMSIIGQIEEANNDQSLGGRVAARVIDTVLPAPSAAQCTNEK